MIEKTFTYVDFKGVKRTETKHFHLMKSEIMELEMTTEGGLAERIQRVVNAKDTPTIIHIFKDLILRAYGELSEDGRRMIKNDELREEFSQTEMYSQLFMELATNDEAASEFIIGIMPSDLDDKQKQSIIAEVKKSQQEE